MRAKSAGGRAVIVFLWFFKNMYFYDNIITIYIIFLLQKKEKLSSLKKINIYYLLVL